VIVVNASAPIPDDRAELALDDRERDPCRSSNIPVGKIPVGELDRTPPVTEERDELTAAALDGRTPDGKLLTAGTLDDRERDPCAASKMLVGSMPVDALDAGRTELGAGALDDGTPGGRLLIIGALDWRIELALDDKAPGRPSKIPVGKIPPGGLDVTPPLITERSELRPDEGDGRLAADEAPALIPEMSELKAGTPIGRALDGRADICDRSELSAGELVGKIPVGRIAPDGRALIDEMSELSAGAPLGTAPDGRAESCERRELSAGPLDGKIPVGSTDAPDGRTLLCETGEPKADTPEGRTLDCSAPTWEMSELAAGAFDGKIPVGSTDTPDGRFEIAPGAPEGKPPWTEEAPALICDSKELSTIDGKPEGEPVGNTTGAEVTTALTPERSELIPPNGRFEIAPGSPEATPPGIGELAESNELIRPEGKPEIALGNPDATPPGTAEAPALICESNDETTPDGKTVTGKLRLDGRAPAD
jgi:hypothetical protein